MRSLAQWFMQGRGQAAFVATLATATVLFSWLGAATVGLVTLRRGWSDGLLVLLIALVPAFAWAGQGEIGPLFTVTGTMILALVLKSTSSWQVVLVIAVALGMVTAAMLQGVFPDLLATMLDAIGQWFEQVRTELAKSGSSVEIANLSPGQLAGMIGLMQAFTMVCCLVVARWWQAMLYNPGGFQQEFHQLRLHPLVSFLLAGGLLLMSAAGLGDWLWMMLIPFLFAGIALVHGLVARRGLGNYWLVLFYMALLMMPVMLNLLILLALLDSSIDFRKRAGTPPASKDE